MESNEAVTFFIHELQQGKRGNEGRVWEHFYRRLLPLARKHLDQRVKRVVDEEDIAARAIDECFRQLEAGKVPCIVDRGNLWALLATITERRARNANRNMMCEKRGGGNVRGHSAFIKPGESSVNGFEQIAGVEPIPELAVDLAEQLELHMSILPPIEHQVAKLKLHGFTNREIAVKLNCAVVTVERKLNRIRRRWAQLKKQHTPQQLNSVGSA